MNKWLLGLGAIILWKLFQMDQQVRSTEAAVLDIMADIDETVSVNIQETAAHMGALYEANHCISHQVDLLTLDYLHHLSEYKHIDAMTDRPINSEPYLLDSPDATAFEMALREEGLTFRTRRLKGA